MRGVEADLVAGDMKSEVVESTVTAGAIMKGEDCRNCGSRVEIIDASTESLQRWDSAEEKVRGSVLWDRELKSSVC